MAARSGAVNCIGGIVVEDKLEEMNRLIEEGKWVEADESVLCAKDKKKECVDATTAPTMTTLFMEASRKFQQKKAKPEE